MSRVAKVRRFRKEHGIMRKVVFAPYEKTEPGQKLSLVVRIWALLWQAVNNPQWNAGADVLKVRASAKLLDKFDTVTHTELNEQKQESTRLKYEGGTMLLEDAEMDRLKSAWDTFKPNVSDALAREKVAVEDFLANAPDVTTVEGK